MLYTFSTITEHAGFSQLELFLKRDNSNDPIQTLCMKREEVFQIRCYSNAQALIPHVEHIFVAFKTLPSKFVNKLWAVHCGNQSTTPSLSFSDLVNRVWTPVVDHCKLTIAKLKNVEMTLADIDKEFQAQYPTKYELLQDLQRIHQIAEYPSEVDSGFLENVTTRILQYWELCVYNEPARVLLRVRDRLKLTGDFSIVEEVASQEV